MKKMLFFVAFLATGMVMYADGPRAIGGRLGYGAQFSYQHALGESNMIQLEVGAPGFGALEAACTYDWINPGGLDVPWDKRGDWNWYAGVGGAVQVPFNFQAGFVGVAGRLGIEYNFWFPLQLSLDIRPTLGVGFAKGVTAFGYDLYYSGVGLGVRYLF